MILGGRPFQGRPALAAAIRDAFTSGRTLVAPTSCDPSFDLNAAYAVETELARERRANGHSTVGWKVGYANKAIWRALKLQTLVWAHMYDDTVRFTTDGRASLDLDVRFAPKIEPEIVFKLKSSLPAELTDPVEALLAVDWIALGFEIIDCPYQDERFQPSDFVAAFGLHRALIVGPPVAMSGVDAAAMADALSRFTLKLSMDDRIVDEGSGKNVLRSPVLCLIELGSAMRKQGTGLLQAGDLVSSGTITTSQPFERGQIWRADVEGLTVPSLTIRV